jgi:hypothetical protein
VQPHCCSKDADTGKRLRACAAQLSLMGTIGEKMCFHSVSRKNSWELEDDFDLFDVVLSFKQPKPKVSYHDAAAKTILKQCDIHQRFTHGNIAVTFTQSSSYKSWHFKPPFCTELVINKGLCETLRLFRLLLQGQEVVMDATRHTCTLMTTKRTLEPWHHLSHFLLLRQKGTIEIE